MALEIQLSDDFRYQRGRDIVRAAEDDLNARQDALSDAATVRSMYYGQNGRDITNMPFAGASDIHLPVITDKVETFVPKAKNALTGADPVVRMKRAGNDEYAADDTRE